MKGSEHYRMAEVLVRQAIEEKDLVTTDRETLLHAAQIHATLANAAAVADHAFVVTAATGEGPLPALPWMQGWAEVTK